MTDTTREQYSRTRLLLGQAGLDKLRQARVAVFGVGGVGGYVVEALARSGVGALDLIDDDKVCLSNLNRQIIATRSTLGQYKVDAAAARVRDIDPDIVVRTYKTFYTPETAGQFDFTQYSYVVDAHHLLDGGRQQAGPLPLSGGRHLRHVGLPAGPGDADRVPQTGDPTPQGSLFQRTASCPPDRRNRARNGPFIHRPARRTQKTRPRLSGLCAVGGRADFGGGSDL